MILDLPRFLESERPFWDELETMLSRIDNSPRTPLVPDELKRLQYLYGRSISALGKMATFSAESEARAGLESLVARAYATCYTPQGQGEKAKPWQWISQTFPRTFRRHGRAFAFAMALTAGGAGFGAAAMALDKNAKPVLMPFANLMQSPGERVKQDERDKGKRLSGYKSRFSAELMTHNIQVAFTTMALGATWGVGSTVLVFYNGVSLGAVAADYVKAGYGEFLAGWLLPHGVVEIPAILVAGQAGFVLASALIGWGDGKSRRMRLREASGDILTLAGGAAVMLVWAGVIEAFLSQYHYPVIPYGVKIAFGVVEGFALTLFLTRAGRAA